MLLAGGNVHGRLLLREIGAAGLKIDVVVNEVGTERAAKLSTWLTNQTDYPDRFETLLLQAGRDYIEVDHYHGAVARQVLSSLRPDYVVNGGCGILREDFLNIPSAGFLNAHPGLLPQYRGLDPVLWALAEDGELGATVHVMTTGIDEGPILARSAMDSPRGNDLVGIRLSCMQHGAQLLADVLKQPEKYPPVPQNLQHARYFPAFPTERIAELNVKLFGHRP
ncbi:MAG: formyltransferase family protein [Pseudomonadota bacterium]